MWEAVRDGTKSGRVVGVVVVVDGVGMVSAPIVVRRSGCGRKTRSWSMHGDFDG